MVPKGTNNTYNTKVKMGVKELISSQRFGNGERDECIETKVFGSHKGMPNSHTLKVGVFDLPMVEYVGMRCIYCGYGKGTAGDSNN